MVVVTRATLRESAGLGAGIGGFLVGEIPPDRLLEPMLERGRGRPAEHLLHLRNIEDLALDAIGLARIPNDLALELGEPRDELGELSNGGADAGADVDR